MKILYLSDDYPFSIVHHSLCRNLTLNDINVSAFYSSVKGKLRICDLRSTYTDVDYSQYLHEVDRKEWLFKYDFFYKIQSKYQSLLQQVEVTQFSIVHAATLFSEGAVALKLWKEKGIPYIVAVRRTDIHFYFKYMFHVWNLGLEILKNAKRVIFITENSFYVLTKHFLLKRNYQWLMDKMEVLPNGIDDFWIENSYPKKEKKLPCRLLYIGKFDKNKNVLSLLEAVLSLKKEFPNLFLTLVGGGQENHNKVIGYCNKFPNTFSYLGKIADKKELCSVIRKNDLFVMPSHSETFGLVYLEALSQGLPVLYTKGQGIDGVFAASVGEAVNSRSVSSIGGGIKKIIQKYDSYKSIDDMSGYSWFSIAKKYKQIYLDCESSHEYD
ncbi:glycosyltransferase family 4 protein [Bacteroides sp.]|uniref:glycosyltransferase family 4 protein n=1 Tax=Bacteroides sp. TaxID=29523 RepID=UPI0025C4E014|nr:glycosyltransferase family 4 protein [Bacteroides sp.]